MRAATGRWSGTGRWCGCPRASSDSAGRLGAVTDCWESSDRSDRRLRVVAGGRARGRRGTGHWVFARSRQRAGRSGPRAAGHRCATRHGCAPSHRCAPGYGCALGRRTARLAAPGGCAPGGRAAGLCGPGLCGPGTTGGCAPGGCPPGRGTPGLRAAGLRAAGLRAAGGRCAGRRVTGRTRRALLGRRAVRVAAEVRGLLLARRVRGSRALRRSRSLCRISAKSHLVLRTVLRCLLRARRLPCGRLLGSGGRLGQRSMLPDGAGCWRGRRPLRQRRRFRPRFRPAPPPQEPSKPTAFALLLLPLTNRAAVPYAAIRICGNLVSAWILRA